MNQIKNLLDGLDLHRLADLLGLHPLGGLRRFCPACQPAGGKSPDLTIKNNYGRGRWMCYKCGRRGDGFDLVQHARGGDLSDAVRFIMESSNGRYEFSYPPQPLQTAEKNDWDEISLTLGRFLKRCENISGSPSEAYWAGRGISLTALEWVQAKHCSANRYCALHQALTLEQGDAAMIRAGLTLVSRKSGRPFGLAWAYAKAGVDFTALPYLRDGKLVALKLRPLLNKSEIERLGIPRFLAIGRRIEIFNGDILSKSKRVIICEGESDTLSVLTTRHDAVGIPGARAFRQEWTQRFKNVDRVYFGLDADEAGRQGLEYIARLFEEAALPRPYVLPLPPGKDLNEYLGNK